jgi:hypothetical protein
MATKDVFQVIYTSEAKVNTINYKVGQLIFAEDTRKVYFDGDERTCYESIIKLLNDEARIALTQPIVGFYFTITEGVLWYYTGIEWKQITTVPQEQIQFYSSVEDFPLIGNSQIIYVVNNVMYRWLTDSYKKMEADVDLEWEEI